MCNACVIMRDGDSYGGGMPDEPIMFVEKVDDAASAADYFNRTFNVDAYRFVEVPVLDAAAAIRIRAGMTLYRVYAYIGEWVWSDSPVKLAQPYEICNRGVVSRDENGAMVFVWAFNRTEALALARQEAGIV